MKNILITIFLIGNLYASEVGDELLKDINKYFNIAKEYSIQGKNILIEQTLVNGINGLVDNSKIKVNNFDINNTTNKIYINLFLEGEDKNLTINIDKFQWGVTEDKKYIVFEDFDIDMNIPWIQYIVDDIAKRDNGYIKIPHNAAIIVTNVRLKGSKENLKIDVERYDIATEDGRKTIILKDMKFKEFTKPWIKSILDAHDNEVHFEYTDKLFELLSR